MSDPIVEVTGEIRGQVERCLLAYARGIDRLDAELVLSAFHRGATLDGYGSETLAVEAFVELALPGLRAGFRSTQHRLSNVFVEGREGAVVAESYILATHVEEDAAAAERLFNAPSKKSSAHDRGDGAAGRLFTFAGRYVDRLTERDGQWRIAHRRLRYDWSKVEEIDEAMPGPWLRGARDRTDPIYE